MLQPYHLRVCTDADWPQALALIRNVFVGEGFGSAVRADRWCRREIMEPGGQTLIAVEGDRVIGTSMLAYPGSDLATFAVAGEAELRLVSVAPASRGRGVGELLVRACLERAPLAPWLARTVVLRTQPSMQAAMRIYKRLGFVRAPERDTFLGPEAQGAGGPDTRQRWAFIRPLD